ncbi:MAG: hypothetical protein CMP61_12645 [Flavobacteriales bacterium]|nr:hypothetical protein [Flavobacteriales bacterium]
MTNYPIVPGRGLVTKTAKELRLDYLQNLGLGLESVSQIGLQSDDIKNNIESNVGGVEIPVGLVGPLLFNRKEDSEYVHTLVGTLEGALVASMNRGAKCISMSGGFDAHVIHQKMVRTPMFIFNQLSDSIVFKNWIDRNFLVIKKVAESHSNHAVLESILPYVVGKSVHLKFVFTTGDASGQNMTTACTWHSVLWIENEFKKNHAIEIVHCVIEGNGASDKKVSQFSILHGRGIHVIAEAHLREEIIQKVLRTSSDDIVRCFNQSIAMSKIDGMVGYNINVANAIAGIFSATGQDLACIHESSCGVLNVEKTDDGLYLSLNLPSLVIGTIGGGTHLSKQKEALNLMGCYGNGKVNRFAQLIAGFALSLELSTYAAIVSGQFAKAHEKLGRNKPINWLTKSELDGQFLKKVIQDDFISVETHSGLEMDNGILTNLTSRVSKKLIGFVPIKLQTKEAEKELLIKSKALDNEVIKGLHFMASSIDPELADLIFDSRDHLEYVNSHKKEQELYSFITNQGLDLIPKYYGSYTNTPREIHLFVQELLNGDELKVLNSENSTEDWSKERMRNCIQSISEFHKLTKGKEFQTIQQFNAFSSTKLYKKLIALVIQEIEGEKSREDAYKLYDYLNDLKFRPSLPHTVIHNDFNSRNIAIRNCETPCVYDWELAVIGLPHRDVVEFLAFTLAEDFNEVDLMEFCTMHKECFGYEGTLSDWMKGYEYALKEFMVTRLTFYVVGSILMKYEFAPRVFSVSNKMLAIISKFV